MPNHTERIVGNIAKYQNLTRCRNLKR